MSIRRWVRRAPSGRTATESNSERVSRWSARYWKNVPGPFYTTTDNLRWTLSTSEAPQFLVHDELQDFVWRQPETDSERALLLEAASIEPCDDYARDGDEYWTKSSVLAWWERRDELRDWVESLLYRPVSCASSFWEGRLDAVDLDHAKKMLRYIDEDLESYIHRYIRWLGARGAGSS